MKANWKRHDDITEDLFVWESKLLRADAKPDEAAKDLKEKFEALAQEGIANSHGLDHFLQVAMAWIITYLGQRVGQPDFRVTVARYLPDLLDALLVKPCLIKPGWCHPPQPTISLDKKAKVHGVNERIGHTGLAMKRGEILYCQPTHANCRHYISIDSGSGQKEATKSALCIPLLGNFKQLVEDFEKASKSAVCTNSDYCANLDLFGPTSETGNADSNKLPARWVLNIECVSDALSKNFAFDILKNPDFTAVVTKLIETLDTYQRERSMHLALERSSTLLALATNTLRARPAYRALLREVSEICDGADVTLHLRDLFDTQKADETPEENKERNKRNEARCSVFVTGVGSNYGDFLVNERIGLKVGQIGWALADDEPPPDKPVSNSKLVLNPDAEDGSKVKVQYIVGEEIAQAMKIEPNALPFKQLMPNTFLNVVVPIFFHEEKIGVINIEWDEDHLKKGDPRFGTQINLKDLHEENARTFLEEEYLRPRIEIVYRMADYLSLVIDYFDDLENLFTRNTAQLNKDTLEQLDHDGALRQVMRYYVGEAMKKAIETRRESVSLREAEKRCLRDLIDAVGYFLASSTNLRILVSVRRTSEVDGKKVLEPHVYHWLEDDPDSRDQIIEIADLQTVLATCAYRGIPLFGKIKGDHPHQYLELDEICTKRVLNAPETGQVTYRKAGLDPRYEVGVPLVFGKSMLGTFDLEQFAPNASAQTDGESLTEIRLCSYLQWARAISFLIAYIEDARRIEDSEYQFSAPFKRFVLLCAQLIAEYPVEADQFMGIATNAFAEIVRIKNVQILEGIPEDQDPTVECKSAQLRFRGVGDKRLSWEFDSSAKSLLTSETETKPGKTVTAMMTSYHALMQELQKLTPQELSDQTFVEAIEKILNDLNDEKWLAPSQGASEALLNVFDCLHKSLERHLIREPNKANSYAWFLHLRSYDSEGENQYWVCDPRSTAAKNPFSYCYTEELEEILVKVHEQRTHTNDLKDVFSSVLQTRAEEKQGEAFNKDDFQQVIDQINALLPGNPNEEDIVKAITSQLSRRKKDNPGDTRPSFTKTVASVGRAIVVPNLNLSPNRSERDHGWFWREIYTVVGVPFKLNDECVAVLNVFRRRDSHLDNKFFRIDEKNQAQQLAKRIDELLKKLVRVERFAKPSKEEFDQKLAPFREKLEKLSVGKKDGKAKLIVIRTPFARSEESFEVIREHLFSERAHPDLRDPASWGDNNKLKAGNVIIHRISKDQKTNFQNLLKHLPSAIEGARYLFLFVANGKDLRVAGRGQPFYVGPTPTDLYDETLLQRDVDVDKELYYKWLLGRAMEHVSPDANVLARHSDNWTHQKFREWVVKHGMEYEGADLYEAKNYLGKITLWRPTENLLCLNTWGSEYGEE